MICNQNEEFQKSLENDQNKENKRGEESINLFEHQEKDFTLDIQQLRSQRLAFLSGNFFQHWYEI